MPQPLALLAWFLLGSLCLGAIPNVMALQGTSVYLHRTLTHRSLKMPWLVELIFRFNTWITTGIVARYWAGLHREHHAHTDQEEDPHSPYWFGFWRVQLGNVFLYREGCRKPDLLEKFAKDIKPDRWDTNLFDRPLLGLGLGTAALVVFGFIINRNGWWIDAGGFWANGLVGAGMGLLGAFGHAVSYMFVQSSSVNGLCHTPHAIGYQHTDVVQAKTTYNNLLVALITAGEGLHHNHHWMQMSARFARTKLEVFFDSGWWTIWTMKQLRLASNVKVAPLLH